MQDISLDGVLPGPETLEAFLLAATAAERSTPLLADNGDPVSGQVTFITYNGRRIAAIVPPDVGEIHLEDTLGMPLGDFEPTEGSGT